MHATDVALDNGLDACLPAPAPRTYLACVGTRPEIIKMAPVYRQLKARGHRVRLVHTGQHGEVAAALYAFFDMRPDLTIDLRRKSGSLSHLTTALLDGIDASMTALRPDVLIVQGDTTTALAGTLAAFYHQVPVAHVEAGLRTHADDPFPEEKNRELIGRLACWHFPPTPQARRNLLAEGILASRVFEVGNTVIDATLWARSRIRNGATGADTETPPPLAAFLHRHDAHGTHRRLILITAHRRENWGAPIRNIATAAIAILQRHPEAIVVWPVHPNPSVRHDVEMVIGDAPAGVCDRLCLVEPLGYPVLIGLLANCSFTLTDSGGIQEEASALGVPVLVARDSTERQELVAAGGALLVGTDIDVITGQAHRLLTDEALHQSMRLSRSPFGDGTAGQQIASILSDRWTA